MKKLYLISLLALLLGLATGCEFRPLEDPANVSYVRVYVNDEMLNVTRGFYDDNIRRKTGGAVDVHLERPDYSRPEILRIGIFDTNTGDLVVERYLRNQGDDERGHYYEGYLVINPGTYNLVAYNFGTESTIIGQANNCYRMNAYTNEIASSIKSKLKSRTKDPTAIVDEVIRYDADPLFVAGVEGLDISYHSRIDTLRSVNGDPWFSASSVVKSYYLQIGVIGAQYISASSCLLTGMASSTHTLEPDFEQSEETTLYFEMKQGVWPAGYRPGYDEFHCIYTTFGTFGCLPDANKDLMVSLEFTTTYGAQIDTTFNLSTEFLKADAIDNQWILPDFEIKIPPPPGGGQSGGGMAPGVEEWGDVNSDINI